MNDQSKNGILVGTPGDFKCVIIDAETTNLFEAMGLTQERFEYLELQVRKAILDSKVWTQVACQVSQECLHPNEVFVLGVLIGTHMEEQRNPILGLLSKLHK